MAQGRQKYTPEDVEAMNLADKLQLKALDCFRANGSTAEEKGQIDWLKLRINARIASRMPEGKPKTGDAKSIFLKSSDKPLISSGK